jgi:hypothetical protein
MNTHIPEEADEWIAKLIADEDWPEFSSTPKSSIPWQEKPPTSWAEFLSILVRFCNYHQWGIIFDDVDDCSVAIFANKMTDGVDERPFDEESFPF